MAWYSRTETGCSEASPSTDESGVEEGDGSGDDEVEEGKDDGVVREGEDDGEVEEDRLDEESLLPSSF